MKESLEFAQSVRCTLDYTLEDETIFFLDNDSMRMCVAELYC